MPEDIYGTVGGTLWISVSYSVRLLPFYMEMAAARVQVTNIGLEAPYQLGKTEREGSVWKKIAKKVIEAKQIVGMDEMKILAHEVNATKMDMSRVGGFSPSVGIG